MLRFRNIKPRLLLAVFTFALLSVPSAGLIFSDGSNGNTAPPPAIRPTGNLGSACAPSFVLPEAMQRSEAIACEATPAASPVPDLMGKPQRRGFCRCGCGITCQTSADCGGGSCDPFVTCC